MTAVITLKAYKRSASLSRETDAFSANIYIDGKKAGEVMNDGGGGSHYFYFPKPEDEQKVYAAARAWNVINEPGEGFVSGDPDGFINRLCEDLDLAKQGKKLIKGAPAGTGVVLIQKEAWTHREGAGLADIKADNYKDFQSDPASLPWYKVRFDYEALCPVMPGEDAQAIAKKHGAQMWRVVV